MRKGGKYYVLTRKQLLKVIFETGIDDANKDLAKNKEKHNQIFKKEILSKRVL